VPPVSTLPTNAVASGEAREEMLEVLLKPARAGLGESGDRRLAFADGTRLSIETVDGRTVRRLMAAAERSGWRLLVDVEAACLTSWCVAGAESVESMSTEGDVDGLSGMLDVAQWKESV